MSNPTSFDLQPTLVGKIVSLRPVKPDDLDPMFGAASDPLIWEQHPDPLMHQRPAFQRFFSGALACGGALAVVENSSGLVVGSSRYCDWNPIQKEVTIGSAFLTRDHWGGATIFEMKALMLEHAFRWAKVVWFHVGENNWRSRRTLEKIGGVYSHEARKKLNGAVRNWVFFRMNAA